MNENLWCSCSLSEAEETAEGVLEGELESMCG